jgi:hypothetical protein
MFLCNYPYITMWHLANFHVVFEYYWLYRVGSGMVDPKYLLSDVFGRYFVPTKNTPCVLWNYPYITMWKQENFYIAFKYYWLYRVGSVMVDLKYLQSYVFGRYFVPTKSCPCVGMVLSIHNHAETCKFPHCF